MTDKKFTDEEIIQTLERCSKGEGCFGCAKAYMHSAKCIRILEAECLDLINHQKAEIERLEAENKIYIEANQVIGYQRDQRDKEIDELQKQIDGLDVRENKIKTEACKNFSQKLIKASRLIVCANGFDIKAVVDVEKIAKILKETVGEEP